MDASQEQLACELSKKYAFETFDFKSKSPKEFVEYYQATLQKISKVIESQNNISSEESLENLSEFNCYTY